MKLEANKTYVFKDDECKKKYLKTCISNGILLKRFYEEGFTLEEVGMGSGAGYIYNNIVIRSGEIHLFKLKEETPITKPSQPVQEDSSLKVYNHLAQSVYALCECLQLGYEYSPSEKGYYIFWRDDQFKVDSIEKLNKFEQMYNINKELNCG